jgi:hypothetical protein
VAYNQLPAAIELCDRIRYNIIRSRGWLDDDSLSMSDLLANLYVKEGRTNNAMGVYEQVLRAIDTSDDRELADKADTYLEKLRCTHHILGGWARPEREYHDLYNCLIRYGLKTPSVDKWVAPKGDVSGDLVSYVSPPACGWSLNYKKDITRKESDCVMPVTKDITLRKGSGNGKAIRVASTHWSVPINV